MVFDAANKIFFTEKDFQPPLKGDKEIIDMYTKAIQKPKKTEGRIFYGSKSQFVRILQMTTADNPQLYFEVYWPT